jgi:hypothetical protein
LGLLIGVEHLGLLSSQPGENLVEFALQRAMPKHKNALWVDAFAP